MTVEQQTSGASVANPRSVFTQRLSALFQAAGNPSLSKVASATAARMQATHARGQASPVSAQRISDWRSGRNVPARFESLLPVLLTLTDMARRSSAKADPVLLKPAEWKRLWQACTVWRPEDEDSEVCPYLGLTSYGGADTPLFFGRSRATAELTALVHDGGGVVALIGASGAGKSSLLHAGLVPALAGRWATATMTPGTGPLAALTASLDTVRDASDPALLVIDQFEEIFTLTAEHERDAFLALLADAAVTEPNLTIVIAVRADFYASCLDYPVLEEALTHRDYVLGPMRADELAHAITGPAEHAGLKLEPGLVELVITELRGLGSHPDRPSYDPGALPLLSHVMAATWQQREGRSMTVGGYRKAGSVAGSVAETAEQAWSGLSDTEQAEAQQLLLRLTTVGHDGHDTRRRIARSELIATADNSDAMAAALEGLTRARLLTVDHEIVFFTHEIVLHTWPRLRTWLDEGRVGYLVRQRLEADAADWVAAGRDLTLVYRGSRLTAAQQNAGRVAAGSATAEFLAAAAHTLRRANRRHAAIRVGAALIGVVVLVLAVAAIGQNRLATEQHSNATLVAVLAEADSVRASDPSLSAQLDVVAYRLAPTDNEVFSRLLSTQNMPLATPLAGHSGRVGQVAFGGALLASASEDHTVRLWDVANPAHRHELGVPLRFPDPVTFVGLNPAGTVLITATAANAVRLWNISDPTKPRPYGDPFPDGNTALTAAAVSRDAGLLATAGEDGTVRLWNISDPAVPTLAVTLTAPSPVGAMAFGAGVLATAGRASGDTVQLWSVADPATAGPVGPPLAAPLDHARAVAISPDGRTLAIGSGDELPSAFPLGSALPTTVMPGNAAVQLWDIADRANARPLSAPFDVADRAGLRSITFTTDNSSLITADSTGAAWWNIVNPEQPTLLGDRMVSDMAPCIQVSGAGPDCKDDPTSVAVAADGHTVAVGRRLGGLQLWSTAPALRGTAPGDDNQPAFDADGDIMVSAFAGRKVHVWDTRNHGSPRQTAEFGDISPLNNGASIPMISPDSRTLATTDNFGPPIRLLDLTDRTRPTPVAELPDSAVAAFSPDSRKLVTLPDPYSLRVWDLADRQHPRMVSTTRAYNAIGAALAGFFVTDRVYASMGFDRLSSGELTATVKLWDLSDPTRPTYLATLPKDPSLPFHWFQPRGDGHTLVTMAADTLQAWDVRDPRHIHRVGDPLVTHNLNVQAIDFSPNGRWMATSGSDSAVRLWDYSDPAHPRPVGHSIVPPSTTMWSITFNPAGGYLIGTGQSVMAVWDLDPRHAIDRICRTTQGVLTPAVWQAHLPQIPYRPAC